MVRRFTFLATPPSTDELYPIYLPFCVGPLGTRDQVVCLRDRLVTHTNLDKVAIRKRLQTFAIQPTEVTKYY